MEKLLYFFKKVLAFSWDLCYNTLALESAMRR